MGLLDEVLKQAAGGALSGGAGAPGAGMTPGGQHAQMLDAVIGMLGNQQAGGLDGVKRSFDTNGLGDLMSSWVSTGQNQPISPAQVQQGLGGDVLGQLAQKVGVSPQMASTMLTMILPLVIDRLTPKGQMPNQASLPNILTELMKGR